MAISVAEAHRICAAGELEALQQFIMRNGDTVLRSIDGEEKTLFFVACENGHFDLARWLYTVTAGENASIKDRRGWAPILAACASGHLDVARWLFAEESDICSEELRAPTLPGGWTPMIIACKQGHLAVAQWLLDEVDSSGRAIHARTTHGWAPVWIACTFGQQHILKWLLANGADPTIADHNGHTPLYQATSCNHFHLIPSLVLAGAASAPDGNFRGGSLDSAVLKRDVFKPEAQVYVRRALGALVQQAQSFVGDVLCAAALWRPRPGGNPWPPHAHTCSSTELELDVDKSSHDAPAILDVAEGTCRVVGDATAITSAPTVLYADNISTAAAPATAALAATNSDGLELYLETDCTLCGDLLVPPLGHAFDLIQLLGCQGGATTPLEVSIQPSHAEETRPSNRRRWDACCAPVHAGCHLIASANTQTSAPSSSTPFPDASSCSAPLRARSESCTLVGGLVCHSCTTPCANVARRYRRRLKSTTSSSCDVSLVQLPPPLAAFSPPYTASEASNATDMVVAVAPCPLSKLCGHETTLLQLVADFAGVVRGRQLRWAREALKSLPT